MDTLLILSLVLGVFGLLAFARVTNLSKQVYLLRSDLKLAVVKSGSGGGENGESKSSCGCGGNC